MGNLNDRKLRTKRFFFARHLITVTFYLMFTALLSPLWAQEIYAPHDALFSTHFATEAQGWACGRWGSILHTEDGGKTWSRQESGTDLTLSDIFFTDPQTGWAVGNGGTILHTTDGGTTWVKQESPVPFFHMGVHFATPLKGWIASERTHILYTEDGGSTWQVQFRDEDYKLKAIAFSDELHGWAVGEYGYTYATRDGGKTWEHQNGHFRIDDETGELQTGVFLFDVAAIDSNRAVAVGADGLVLKTTDGGMSWNKLKTGAPKTHLFGVTAEEGGTIVISGKGVYQYSNDNGQTWHAIKCQPTMEYSWLYAVSHRGTGKFAAVGESGAIYLSDSQDQWKRVNY